ncbi:elongator complex protein 2-like [Tubulanus polymorphus]|uniref:elongator complex protein 2-like n=1 Tax=Tubulanus polymorphus TaxID=672921 RepID=UPI003DA5B236
MKKLVDTIYVSSGCNRTPNSASWGLNELICYGSANACHIYDTSANKVVEVVTGHRDRVNCIQWIPRPDQLHEDEFVSGSADKTVNVWKRNSNNQFECVATLSGHKQAVDCIAAVYAYRADEELLPAKPRTIIASASVDSTVHISVRDEGKDEFDSLQSLSFGTGFALALAFITIPATNVPLLACGADDSKIHLFIEQNKRFVKVHTLTGHEDWIRGLEFTVNEAGEILLASSAQDCFIRIWKFSKRDPDIVAEQQRDIKQLSLSDEIKLKENIFTFSYNGEKCCYAVVLETVLSGHDNWVYAVHWQRKLKGKSQREPSDPHEGKSQRRPLRLLSASMDKTMIVWNPDPETGVWLEQVRVGEVGGNTLGLYGCQFGPDGYSILSHGYQGGFHLWKLSQNDSQWRTGVVLSGHFNSVEDMSWDPIDGQYLLTVSTDQTTRLHAPWIKPDKQVVWHEIARPQVHGYDLKCLTMINKYRFASGADEKVIRIFDAPKNFLENYARICEIDVSGDLEKREKLDLPEGASVPALGLSNKAVYQSDQQTQPRPEKTSLSEYDQDAYFLPKQFQEPPVESDLVQNTLWPEVQKLYGHGNEIFALASNADGTLLASACKAAKPDHAVVILWDLLTYRKICELPGHSLTVTQLAFSYDGKYLLSVSRDRTWSLFTRSDEDGSFIRCAFTDKKTSVHSRIIWSCCWSPDDEYFFTASRDKKVISWRVKGGAGDSCLGFVTPQTPALELKDSVTAVHCAPVMVKNSYLLACGLDNGQISIVTYNPSAEQPQQQWTIVAELSMNSAHHSTVKRLAFRNQPGRAGVSDERRDEDNANWLQFASCSCDHSVKIFNIYLPAL